jgi:DNA-binding response OmpR family regulator
MSEPLNVRGETVVLFNASDDTIEMVQNVLKAAADDQTLVGCRFADLKRGVVDFATCVAQHNPEVVIVDLSPPYDENWRFFVTMRDSEAMKGRGLVLTTTNKDRLDEVLGADSHALEVVGRRKDLQEIETAIRDSTRRVRASGPPAGATL